MARSKKREQEKGLDKTVGVKLTDEQVSERGALMAAKVIYVGTLRKKRREDLRSINAEIESNLDEIERLARVVTNHEENRAQADLFVDGGTTKPEEPATGREPLPSEPHKYRPSTGPHGETCKLCGSYAGDGVHVDEMPPPPISDHVFVPRVDVEGESGTDPCHTCSKPRGDHQHDGIERDGEEVIAVIAPETRIGLGLGDDVPNLGHDFEGLAGTVVCAHVAEDGTVCQRDRLSHPQAPEDAPAQDGDDEGDDEAVREFEQEAAEDAAAEQAADAALEGEPARRSASRRRAHA